MTISRFIRSFADLGSSHVPLVGAERSAAALEMISRAGLPDDLDGQDCGPSSLVAAGDLGNCGTSRRRSPSRART